MSALALGALLALSAPAATEAPAVVSGVLLKVPPGEDAAMLEGMVAARAGQPLSARALRRTVTLLYQLGRFSDVTVRAVPAGDGQVVLVVECLPKRVVQSLRVVNRSPQPVVDEKALAQVAGLAVGEEYWSGRLEASLTRLRALYRRRGHREARITGGATGDAQVAVALEVEEGAPTRVTAVELGGVLGPAGSALRAGLATRSGGVLDLDLLDADVKRLRLQLRREGWLRSRVGEPGFQPSGAGVEVSIPVEPGPRISFRVAGNDAYGEKELLARLALEPEQPLDEAALDAAAARLRAFYEQRGFASARVEVRELAGPGRSVMLFTVSEGRRYRLLPVRFGGSQARDTAWLQARLQEGFEAQAAEAEPAAEGDAERLARAAGSTSPPRARPAAEAGQGFGEAAWRQAAARIVDFYRADGFLDAAHEGTRLSLDDRLGTAEVEIRLREGVRTVVESVAFEGNVALPLSRLLAETRLRPGDPLSFAAVEQTRAALLALYARSGYLYARVQDQEELTPDRRSAAVRYRIEEGPRVRVVTVAVAGNRRTREQVVRSALELEAGDAYDPDAVARSQTALLRLGVFRSVGLRLNDPEVPESEKDLTVELAERPWLSVAPGIGFSLANGPRVFVEYSQPNLFGRALELAARAKVNYPVNVLDQRPDLATKTPGQRVEGYANVGLHFPRLHVLPVPLAVHLDGIGERVHRKAYDMTRVSTVLGGDLAVFSRLGFSLQGELEVDDIRRTTAQGLVLTRADVERLRFPEGVTTLVSLRPVLTLDYRDNSAHPRSGWYAALAADYARSLGTGQGHLLLGLLPGSEVFTDMLKLQLTASTYLPLGRSLVLALSLRGGRVFPLDRDSRTIGPKRFYLGGASTMRGYAEDELIPQDLRQDFIAQVAACNSSLAGLPCSPAALGAAGGNPPPSEGGEIFALGKAEARIAIRGSVEAGVFADVGNLWLNPRDAGFGELHVSVGLGLRFITPIGPAALDLGFNTAPDRRLAERVYAPHFSIGLF